MHPPRRVERGPGVFEALDLVAYADTDGMIATADSLDVLGGIVDESLQAVAQIVQGNDVDRDLIAHVRSVFSMCGRAARMVSPHLLRSSAAFKYSVRLYFLPVYWLAALSMATGPNAAVGLMPVSA